MAREPEKRTAETEALIQRLEASRSDLGEQVVDLRQRLDVPTRIKSSVKGKPWLWFGGAMGAGLVLGRILRRPKKTKIIRKKNPLIGFALTTGFALLKTALKQVVTNELQRRRTAQNKTTEEGLPLPKPRFPRSKGLNTWLSNKS